MPRDISDAALSRARTLLTFGYGVATLLVVILIAWQFHATRHLASSIAASGAVLAIVIGLAAQGTLGNPVAGIVLAFSQPVRVGDIVKVDEFTGRVSRIGLTFTRIEVADGSHIEYPNSILVTLPILVLPSAPPPHGHGDGAQA